MEKKEVKKGTELNEEKKIIERKKYKERKYKEKKPQ